jgi:pimeloyl-ACP methyl ester carboxylesterase
MEVTANRRKRRVRKSLAVGLCLLVVGAFTVEQIGRMHDRRLLPQVGTSYDVGGRTLNLYCTGRAGPTVVFDSGASDPGYAWTVIQARVALFARACWWDRAGFGWSGPAPYPMTVDVIAKDLHNLLHAAGISGPYILVGDSFGGFVVRVYNRLYPQDVGGMLLVDAAHEDAGKYIPDWGRAKIGPLPHRLRYPVYLAAKTVAASGLLRVLQRERPFNRPGWTPEQAHVLARLRSRADLPAAEGSIGLFNDDNERLVRASGGLGDKPLLVLTAGLPLPVPAPLAASAAAYQEIWKHQLQPQFARLSSRGRQIIVANAGHGMMFDMPDEVVGAIREIVNESRSLPQRTLSPRQRADDDAHDARR